MTQNFTPKDLARIFIERTRDPTGQRTLQDFLRYDVKFPYTESAENDKKALEELMSLLEQAGISRTPYIDPNNHEQGTQRSSRKGEFTLRHATYRADAQLLVDDIVKNAGLEKMGIAQYVAESEDTLLGMELHFTFHVDDFPKAKAHLEAILNAPETGETLDP